MKSQILEGSRAIALTIKNIKPDVVSAYPITPQTHIVEDLAKFKADGEADYEYVRAESEFAAASIVAGASATGARAYTATSSQGLLLMNEAIYNIAGMRLPIVLTCANRGLSAPITIWNDQQDVMSIRDAGWILLFAEDHQETVSQHIMAFKLAESLKLPVMVNVDGFIITHSYQPVTLPDAKLIKKYLPAYKPAKGEYLDVEQPASLGCFAPPGVYMEIRQELHDDLVASLKNIEQEYKNYNKIIGTELNVGKTKIKNSSENGLLEFYGNKKAETVLIAMGSVVGTIKEIVDENKDVAVIKIKCFRPFPERAVLEALSNARQVAVVDKSISLGQYGPLAADIKAAAQGKLKAKIQSFIVGLGGRDITREMIRKIIKEVKSQEEKTMFVGKV